MLTEYEEQKLIVQWAKSMHRREPLLRLLHASLNGVRLPMKRASMMKASGMLSGVPDLFLPVRNETHSGLYIELKREKGGKVSDAQQWFIDSVTEQGYRAEVCRGHMEAINLIKEYLSLK